MLSAQKLFSTLTNNLSDRQKEVVFSRFGLMNGGEYETLAAIGDRMGVTRERIRQIERSAMELLVKQILKDPTCTQIIARSKKFLKDSGGVSKNDALLRELSGYVDGFGDYHINLLTEATGAFYAYPEDENFWPFYYLGKVELKNAASFVDSWTDSLNVHKTKVLGGEYETHFKNFLKSRGVDKRQAENYLSISKKIQSNPFGDIGLRDWPEIKPATTRDRIYLVLRKKQTPLHFADIAKAINEVKFGSQVALAPTVHNELIKDNRFVLVGRGVYALREHGYEPGIAREVIAKVLKQEGPLYPRDVVGGVSKQRLFKPNTILINLQNKTYFERLPDGRYRVRES